MERVKFLEEKLQEIARMVQNIAISTYKETFKHKINQMEIKLTMNVVDDTIKDRNKHKNLVKLCRYYRQGYCRKKEKCEFKHVEEICDKFLDEGKCADRFCSLRHPKSCKFWVSDPRGCFREENCKYLHNIEKVGSGIKDLENTKKGSESITEKVVSEVVVKSVKEKVDKTIDKAITAAQEEISELKKLVASKDTLTKEIIDETDQVKAKNKNLNLELEKFKRIVPKMAKQIESLKE